MTKQTASGAGIIAPPSLPDRPRRSPNELADLVTRLPKQEQAELVYDLVVYAARAVEENDIGLLAGALAEMEDIAAVNTDPDLRFALEEEVEVTAAAVISLDPINRTADEKV